MKYSTFKKLKIPLNFSYIYKNFCEIIYNVKIKNCFWLQFLHFHRIIVLYFFQIEY